MSRKNWTSIGGRRRGADASCELPLFAVRTRRGIDRVPMLQAHRRRRQLRLATQLGERFVRARVIDLAQIESQELHADAVAKCAREMQLADARRAVQLEKDRFIFLRARARCD